MKSVPVRQVRQAEARRVEGDAGDVQRRLAGLVEHQLELVAVQQVDAVERGVLRGGVDLLQDVVVLGDQVGAGRLGVASATGAEAVEKVSEFGSVPPMTPPAAAEPIVEDA